MSEPGGIEADLDAHMAEVDAGDLFAAWAAQEGLDPDDPHTRIAFDDANRRDREDWLAGNRRHDD